MSNVHYPLPITLIGEEIAGPWNADALADIAQAFGGSYCAYAGTQEEESDRQDSLLSQFEWLLAAENSPGAQSVYQFRPLQAGSRALVMGNEAKGIRRRTLKRVHATIEIPLVSKNINCLNVAAAAAILLYYLGLERSLPQKRRPLAAIQKQRPDLLLIGGADHMELGSTVRSACAFGWEHLFLEDRADAWYACDRLIKSEGRGAARRGRNPIRVIPCKPEVLTAYRKMVVFTTHPCGRQPFALPLIGKDLLMVVEDEKQSSVPWSPPSDWQGEVTYASLPSVASDRYHYRQMSAIALAEIARQLGQPDSDGLYLRSRKDRYRREIEPATTPTDLDLIDLLLF